MKHSRISESLTNLVRPIFQRPPHLQVAALCMRARGNRREVLLVSSLATRRWILPKGWPMKGRTLAEAALQEAWEEAGVVGTVEPEPIGHYMYRKSRKGGLGLRCRVEVFRVNVDRLHDDFPEKGKRKRLWVSLRRAAKMVSDADLRGLLNSS